MNASGLRQTDSGRRYSPWTDTSESPFRPLQPYPNTGSDPSLAIRTTRRDGTLLVSLTYPANSNAPFAANVSIRPSFDFPPTLCRCVMPSFPALLLQENLRKHVLSTNLHPGKTIYECDVCHREGAEPFRTNFAKELRAHLLEAHDDAFPTPGHANDYVLGIFEVHRNSTIDDGQS